LSIQIKPKRCKKASLAGLRPKIENYYQSLKEPTTKSATL